MSARAGLRLFSTARASRQFIRQPFRRRLQTDAGVNADATSSRSGFSKLWNSPVGPKTVHFWLVLFVQHSGAWRRFNLYHGSANHKLRQGTHHEGTDSHGRLRIPHCHTLRTRRGWLQLLAEMMADVWSSGDSGHWSSRAFRTLPALQRVYLCHKIWL